VAIPARLHVSRRSRERRSRGRRGDGCGRDWTSRRLHICPLDPLRLDGRAGARAPITVGYSIRAMASVGYPGTFVGRTMAEPWPNHGLTLAEPWLNPGRTLA